jgi:hypothetical protein
MKGEMKDLEAVPAETNGHIEPPEPIVTAPSVVGLISVAEAEEIKTLNSMINELSVRAILAQRVVQVTAAYKNEFINTLIRDRNLDPNETYEVNESTGRITRTGSNT